MRHGILHADGRVTAISFFARSQSLLLRLSLRIVPIQHLVGETAQGAASPVTRSPVCGGSLLVRMLEWRTHGGLFTLWPSMLDESRLRRDWTRSCYDVARARLRLRKGALGGGVGWLCCSGLTVRVSTRWQTRCAAEGSTRVRSWDGGAIDSTGIPRDHTGRVPARTRRWGMHRSVWPGLGDLHGTRSLWACPSLSRARNCVGGRWFLVDFGTSFSARV
jgi:hypothetical protein